MKIAKWEFAACIAAVLVLTVKGVMNATETTDLNSDGYCQEFVSGGEVLSDTASATPLLSAPRSAPGANCLAGTVEWSAPRGKRLLTFYRERSSFSVEMRLMLPPSASGNFTAHILRGGREFPVTIPDGEELTVRSYCGQVSLLVDAGTAERMMGNGSSNFTLVFEYKLVDIDTEGCPRCSESCMLRCMCKSDHIVVGTVLQSIKEGHSYRHKVDVQYYLKYNGCQDPQRLTTPLCPGQQPEWWQQREFTADDQRNCAWKQFIDVIGKCKLVPGQKYIISGHGWHYRERSLSMHLCCADTAYKSVWLLYQLHLNNKRCCVFNSN